MSALLLALALTATTSTSKLGVVVGNTAIGPSSPAWIILTGCPRVAVFQLDGTNAGDVALRIQGYLTACPGGTVVAEMMSLGGTFISVDASMFPTWWNSVWFIQLQTAALLGRIDVVVGPPNVSGTNGAGDVAKFWAAFAQQIITYGQQIGHPMLPAIGAVGPGVPTDLQGFCASLADIRSAGTAFAWSYHGRSSMVSATTDNAVAYRQITTACQLGTVPLYITQAGTLSATWQSSDLNWLWWLEQQLAQDNVAAAALFAIGTSPDLSAIATSFALYLANPGPQSGSGGGGGGGGGSGAVLPPQSGGTTGDLSPSNGGCATGEPGLLALLALPALGMRALRRGRAALRLRASGASLRASGNS